MGGSALRRVEAGTGRPDVVLEAGRNDVAASWRRVMPLLAPHVHVAAYDRAGLGGSAPSADPVTLAGQAGDLASVISSTAAGPCVLAGHSWGGIVVQLLAWRRPDPVAGLVLVDPAHEQMTDALPGVARRGSGSCARSGAMSYAAAASWRARRHCGSCAARRSRFRRAGHGAVRHPGLPEAVSGALDRPAGRTWLRAPRKAAISWSTAPAMACTRTGRMPWRTRSCRSSPGYGRHKNLPAKSRPPRRARAVVISGRAAQRAVGISGARIAISLS